MAQPGQFNPRGEDWIVRKLAELEREIQQLRAQLARKSGGN